jgi:esterase/lipase superfamily enzyme
MSKKIIILSLFGFITSCAQKQISTEKTAAIPAPTTLITSTASEPEKTISQSIAEIINKSKTEKFSKTLAVDVYYATNRSVNNKPSLPCSNDSYGIGLGDQTQYGVCKVNVPKKHATGTIESSPDARADSHKYFKIINEKKLDFETFQSNLNKNSQKEVLVFIHGFNVKFQEAIFRASQIAYDLKFQGPVILFSWPAGAESGFINNTLISRTYDTNKRNAKASLPAALDFFDLISRLDMKTYVYIHSMGHQVAIPALVNLAKESDINLLVHELILNAPDFDLRDFENLAPHLLKLAKRITLYCSYNDTAMLASETLNGGTRLGACKAIDGVDVINVSEIDNPTFGMGLGHGYYSSRAVLTDVAQLIMGLEAENRLFIRQSEPNSTENFYLRP